MSKRKIIKIDEAKCDGCGLCIPNCPEGALQIVDGKARLISDLSCDGLGACIGHCPRGAITIEEREAQEYDERKVMRNIIKQGENVIKAHLIHLKEHNQELYLRQAIEVLKEENIDVPFSGEQKPHSMPGGCPGMKMMDFRKKEPKKKAVKRTESSDSELGQWPVQIMLVPPFAPYLNDSDLLIAADCVPFAYADFHRGILKGKALLVGCPKLDDISVYQDKITQILKQNNIKSITYAHMEVPCCFGLIGVIESAIASSGKKVLFKDVTISIKGERIK